MKRSRVAHFCPFWLPQVQLQPEPLAVAAHGSSTAASGGAKVLAVLSRVVTKLTAYAWDKRILKYPRGSSERCCRRLQRRTLTRSLSWVIEQSGGGDIENAITLAGSATIIPIRPTSYGSRITTSSVIVADYPDAFVPVEGADSDWDGFSKGGKAVLLHRRRRPLRRSRGQQHGYLCIPHRLSWLKSAETVDDDMAGIKWSDLTDIGEQVYAKTGKYLFPPPAQTAAIRLHDDAVRGRCRVQGRRAWITGGTKRCIVSAETIVDMGKRKDLLSGKISWSDYIDQSIQGDMVAGAPERQLDHPHQVEAGPRTPASGRSPPFLRWTAAGLCLNGGCGLYHCQLRQC